MLKLIVWCCLIAGTGVVIGLSVWQGQYNLDPHHWGLQLSNAVDLQAGRTPYQEIFVQYGILTAVLDYLFLTLLGGSNLSLILGTSILYALGLLGVFFMTRELFGDARVALLAYLTNLIIHPLAIYPWSNYMAYPFIVFGLLLIIKGERNAVLGFSGGLLFGLAVLVRENLFVALAPVLVLLLPIRFLFGSEQFDWKGSVAALVGGLAPLSAFGFYLWSNDLVLYWRITAFELPSLYAEHLLSAGFWPALLRLVQYLGTNVAGLIALAGGFVWALGILRVGHLKKLWSPSILIVALSAGLLFSSALVLNEVFRLATGAFLGIGLVYGLALRLIGSKALWPVGVVVLGLSALMTPTGNYFYPSDEEIEVGIAADDIAFFRGHRWPEDVYDYYRWYQNTMDTLANRNCGIEFLRNDTFDMFLTVLSPFDLYQLSPAGLGMNGININLWEGSLRPDFDMAERMRQQDVVFVAQDGVEGSVPPENYRVLGRRLSPPSHFNYWNTDTLIFAPDKCFG